VLVGVACASSEGVARKATAKAADVVYYFLLPAQKAKSTPEVNQLAALLVEKVGLPKCGGGLASVSVTQAEVSAQCIEVGQPKDMPQGAVFLGEAKKGAK